MEGSKDGDPQSLVFGKTDLENREHMVKITSIDRGGKSQVNVDYLKVYVPETSIIVDKTALQAAIKAHQGKSASDYTEATFTVFKEAMDAAMNSDATTEAEILDLVEALNRAAEALEEQMVNLEQVVTEQ